MHSIQPEIAKPTNEDEFEDMCANVYGVVFGDPAPQKNGRRGQKQHGVDVFVRSSTGGQRVGIQCKRYKDGSLTLRHVREEIQRADDGGARITRLIVATTAASDSALVAAVHSLSDEREATGLFPVQVDSWEDLCRHIRSHERLQPLYVPQLPGGLMYRIEEQLKLLGSRLQAAPETGSLGVSLPSAKEESLNKYVSGVLDDVNGLLKDGRFADAEATLRRIGSDQTLFDAHQRARWQVQMAACHWAAGNKDDAAHSFMTGAELYPDDEKMEAAGIRGLLLLGKVEAALERGEKALQRFPLSQAVWLSYANAAIEAGKKVRLNDAPAHLRDDPEVLHTVAWGHHKRGDLNSAAAMSLRAAKASGSSFFVRAAALGFALQKAVGPTAGLVFGAFPAHDRAALQEAVDGFKDRAKQLWPVQAVQAVDAVAAHLALAYLALGHVDDSLQVLNEARVHGRMSSGLLRQGMDALRRQGKDAEAVALGREWLVALQSDGLLMLGEIAANLGDVQTVELSAARAAEAYPTDSRLRDGLVSLGWLGLWRSGQQEQAAAQVLASELHKSESLTLLNGGVHILSWAEKVREVNALADRAVSLQTANSSDAERLMLADLLFVAGRHEQAAAFYEPFVHPGQHTQLHNRLLHCYVRIGARQKARGLLAGLPDGWPADEDTRLLAIELGQRAGDLALLQQLADDQVRHAPDSASSWTFKLAIGMRTSSVGELSALVQGIPEQLVGGPRQHAQLAAFDFRYGDKAKGMRRLYRMYRQDIDSPEAAAAYVLAMVGAGEEELPFMDTEVLTVQAGTEVTLVDEADTVVKVPIDPDGLEVPASHRFLRSTDMQVAPLLGRAVGDEVSLPGSFGQVKVYRVAAMRSVYRHLLDHAFEVISHNVTAVKDVLSVPTPMKDGRPDLSHIHEVLKRANSQSELVLQAYRNYPLPLGTCARMLGKSSIDVVLGWPHRGPALAVCAGTLDERSAAQELLLDANNVYVVDTVTLAELAYLGVLDALGTLPKVLVSTATRDAVLHDLELAKDNRASGQAVDHEGELRYAVLTDEQKAQHVKFCQSIADALAKYCEVAPAYGPATPSADLSRCEKLLQTEEHAALMLAAERGAVLFSLDHRLRQLAASFGIKGVWVQPVLWTAAAKDELSSVRYSLANVLQLLANRSFVSLNAADIATLCHQSSWLQFGLQRVKEYITSNVSELNTVLAVFEEFLDAMVRVGTPLKACAELVAHLAEAILRRPDVSPDLAWALLLVAEVVADKLPIGQPERQRFMDLVTKRIDEAVEHVKASDLPRPVNVEVLYCTKFPMLVTRGPREAQSASDEQSADAAGPIPPQDTQLSEEAS